MVEAEDFPTFLGSRLLQGTSICAYHVSTAPSTCPPLFAPGPRRSEEATTLESHFLTISQTRTKSVDSVEQAAHVLVLGIEILIFKSNFLTTVFVSKADSTGLLERSRAAASSQRTSLAQTVITAFLEFLLKANLGPNRLVLSLFARSQNQYLFPGSVENVTKHILDDRQLIKWWCKVLDPVARHTKAHGSLSVKAHVVVPGCDGSETKAFFPLSSRTDLSADPVWLNTYPVELLAEDSSLPPRCLVPRLPDDPKSRFLDDLDTHVDENGIWRGIKTLEQFWEMMSYRQECSAGRLVGFVWVVLSPIAGLLKIDQSVDGETSVQQQQHAEQQSLLTSNQLNGHRLTGVNPEHAIDLRDSKSNQQFAARSPESAPETVSMTDTHALTTTRTKAVTSTVNPATKKDGAILDAVAETSLALSVSTSPGHIFLSPEDYTILMDELLQLDFAGEQIAASSTHTWRQKAMALANVPQFGIDIQGTSHATAALAATTTKSQPTVNVLTGIRKKRKAEPSAATVDTGTENKTLAHTLAIDLTRKKPKA